MKKISLLLTLIFFLKLNSQSELLRKWNFKGYGETYYCYDFSKPINNERPDFLYNHKRHNELNFNLLFVKGSFSDSFFKANLGLMAGNYAQYNLSNEPTWAQFIFEANFGVKLSKKKNLWLETGIFPSHIGFESAISEDCWTLTRSILAENSPYYESGLKLSYTSKKENLFLSAMYLNGWQKITKPNNFQSSTFGLQVTLKHNSKYTLNYSNFFGTNSPDSLNSFRHFHNFYAQIEPSNKFGIIAGFDVDFENSINKSYSSWYSPVIILRQQINKKFKMAMRGEYYNDIKEIVIKTKNNNGFETFGYSLNFDYNINSKISFRIEGKTYQSTKIVFNNSKENYCITSNLTFRL